MAEPQEECKCPPPGLPAWMGTFSDLMSLLMSFFVLLLSFSEMDVLKYKQIAGSMKNAFGVQNQIKVKDIPKGTSVIAQEFRPGKPEPTIIETIQQRTDEITKESLDFETQEEEPQAQDDKGEKGAGDANLQELELSSAAPTEKTEALAKQLASALKEELNSGQIEIEAHGGIVVIRIREKGSFPSGSARLRRQFKPVIAKIRDILVTTKGEIRVAGHTDDRPIRTPLYPSNWELSGARAASVVRELLKGGKLDKKRFSIYGLADTRPLVPNTTEDNRARNRRVEIWIVSGDSLKKPRKVIGVGQDEKTGK
ncbi:MAG: flagellar motor protein MotB [Gammaproteobacteria bacterium]|nr:MAG: flagellar motor protein MotB [Gammaproteobacteria bacterium]